MINQSKGILFGLMALVCWIEGTLLKNLKMLSVNQINAQIKQTEIWKAVNNENHPISVKKKYINTGQERAKIQI